MINVMYLVLLAMLALSVSNEIVDAFKLLNAGIHDSSEKFDVKFHHSKMKFEQAQSGSKKGPIYFNLVPEVEKINDDFNRYIEELQENIRTEIDGPEALEAGFWPSRLEDQGAPTKILIDEKKGETLREKILQARQDYLDLFAPRIEGSDTFFIDQDFLAFQDEIQLGLNEVPDGESWAEHTFNQMPVVAVLTMLNKFKNDSKATASVAIDRLYGKLNEDDVIYDNFEVAIIPNTRKVYQGDKISADVFLTASSSFARSNIKINGRVVNVDQFGRAKTEFTANELGAYNLTAEIDYKDGYGQSQTKLGKLKYDVIAPPDHAPLVSATKMNVFYKGIPNPVSASIIGIREDKLKVSLSGPGSISKVNGTGNYVVNVNDYGSVEINLSGENDRGEKVEFSVPYRTKRIPNAEPMVGNCSGCSMNSGEFRAQTGLRAELKDFVFDDLKYEVLSYELTISDGGDLRSTKNKGGKFMPSTQRLINEASPGDLYYFENIKVKGPDDSVRKMPSMVFRIR